jgi:hypothetical protein
MRLPRRRTLWLSALLLPIIVCGVWFVAQRGRITQANFDRIQMGMSLAEVCALLGEPGEDGDCASGWCSWCDGRNFIIVCFDHGKAFHKEVHLATVYETVTWYAKEGAANIGVKWD